MDINNIDIKELLKVFAKRSILFTNDDGPIDNFYKTREAIIELFNLYKINPLPKFVSIIPCAQRSATANLKHTKNLKITKVFSKDNLKNKKESNEIQYFVILSPNNQNDYEIQHTGYPADFMNIISSEDSDLINTLNTRKQNDKFALVISGTNDTNNLNWKTSMSSTVGCVNQSIRNKLSGDNQKFTDDSLHFAFSSDNINSAGEIMSGVHDLNAEEQKKFQKSIQHAFLFGLVQAKLKEERRGKIFNFNLGPQSNVAILNDLGCSHTNEKLQIDRMKCEDFDNDLLKNNSPYQYTQLNILEPNYTTNTNGHCIYAVVQNDTNESVSQEINKKISLSLDNPAKDITTDIPNSQINTGNGGAQPGNEHDPETTKETNNELFESHSGSSNCTKYLIAIAAVAMVTIAAALISYFLIPALIGEITISAFVLSSAVATIGACCFGKDSTP